MENKNTTSAIPQYSLGKTLLVWAAAAIPMVLLAWGVAPVLAPDPQNTRQFIFTRLAVFALGLVWQFILVLVLL